MKFFSPLRYPGGKGKIAPYIQLLFEQNNLIDGHYVEPYAGGASVALSLLFNEYASQIHINDIDYSIYSLWHSIINEPEEFCKKVYDTQITIEEWYKQKNIQKNITEHSQFEIGFSTFFLNRTNRSGILKSGPIGGYNQQGNWKVDARFNKEDLIERIQKIASYKERIHLYNEDALSLIRKLKDILPTKTLFYFDPPYFNKGKELYVNFYNYKDHFAISQLISILRNNYWIISYDNVDEIKELYQQYRQRIYSLSYSAGKANKGTEVIIYNDNMTIPEISNPTNREEIKNYRKLIKAI